MNDGMKRKSARRKHEKRYDSNGVPRDAKDWTAEDWLSLWRAMQQTQREIGARHGKAKVKQ